MANLAKSTAKAAAVGGVALALSSCKVTNSVESGEYVTGPNGKTTAVVTSNRPFIRTPIGLGTSSQTEFINVDIDKYRAHLQLAFERAKIDRTSHCAVQIMNLMCPGGAGNAAHWVPAKVTFNNASLLEMGVQASQIAAFLKFAVEFDGFKGATATSNSTSSSMSVSEASSGAPIGCPTCYNYNPVNGLSSVETVTANSSVLVAEDSFKFKV